MKNHLYDTPMFVPALSILTTLKIGRMQLLSRREADGHVQARSGGPEEATTVGDRSTPKQVELCSDSRTDWAAPCTMPTLPCRTVQPETRTVTRLQRRLLCDLFRLLPQVIPASHLN